MAQPTTSLCSRVKTQRHLGSSPPRLPKHQIHLAKRGPSSCSPGTFTAFSPRLPLPKPVTGLGLTPGFPLSAQEKRNGPRRLGGKQLEYLEKGLCGQSRVFFKAGASWSSSRLWEQDRWQSPANPDGQAKPSPAQLPGTLPSASPCLQGPTCSHRLTQP